jgi:hypothetical protein
LGRMPVSGFCHLKRPPGGLVTVLPDTASSASNATGNVSSSQSRLPAQQPPRQARTGPARGKTSGRARRFPGAGGDQRGEDG